MGFKKHKNNYDDLADEVDDLVMYGSQASCSMSSNIRLVTTHTLVPLYHVYYITNNTKYPIVKRGRTNE